jgi:hypothetical protein
MTTHIKVMKKLDLMGIGGGRKQLDDEGGQGREFERLLKRLNEAAKDQEATVDEPKEETVDIKMEEVKEEPVEPVIEKKKKKKRKAQEMEVDEPAVPPAVEDSPSEPAAETRVYVPRPMA